MADPANTDEHDAGTVAALQLLIADKSPEEVIDLLRRAFREDYTLLTKVDVRRLAIRESELRTVFTEIAGMLDGQSPLGRIGQERVRENLTIVQRQIESLTNYLAKRC